MGNFCKKCGNELSEKTNVCSNCGAISDKFVYKSRIAAATLALFTGSFGVHRFFLGQWWGIFYLLFFWTYIPWLIGVIEAIVFFATSQESWNEKYNEGISVGKEKGGALIIIALIFPLIAIVGIIAAITIPAYHDYTIRQAVGNTTFIFSDQAKQKVADYFNREQQWPENNDSVNIDQYPNNKYINVINIDKGKIYIEISKEIGTSGTLIFIPTTTSDGITWSCKESTVPQKYLPPNCR